ncbi:tyrosine-type recombinase/integrase [Domibacillus aminovorans]|uniref:Integrase n=1 Tax=Domibacillus aminovorans TaxID=29332 RepID=A0A177LAN4_9BACI|nr:tyrosine-type recombinase/integrase [Domibacillus aminovorans]OAH62352.1 hypothetical protein AWH49_10340 [Domibacillus aminovorans]
MARKGIELDDRQQNVYLNLRNQISKTARHNRQGAFKTKTRYFEATDRFCRFLSKEFSLQKFANIGDKHLKAYVKHLQNQGLAAKTINTDLSAIRFFHDKTERTRNRLSDRNKIFGTEKVKNGGINKAWSHQEVDRFQEVCGQMGNKRMAAITTLARNEGLRIHETLKIDRNAAEKAIKTGEITTKGKGGKVRLVPISSESKQLLSRWIEDVERGQKLFVAEGEKTHLVIKSCQNFINRHREKFQDESRTEQYAAGDPIKENITFHGLRHAYAQDRYAEAKERGLRDRDARLEVSRLLGHERDEVTRIYMAH